MSEYVPTIGLEIHAELKTRTKMFCNSKNDADETRPNANICPVCMAHPGTLPVINREAVRSVLRVGVALGGSLADYTEFDRKNYFYPDLPKGYQLSQYEFPLVVAGALRGVAITRVHLEEDTASSTHNETTGETLVDYNRAGVPLMELVTEPVIHSAKEAGDFAREFQLLLKYLDVSNADMEKGNMRLEANVSVSNSDALGTKVEIKNINSFGIMERAVAYEIERQIELLKKGEAVIQETRGWNDAKQITFSQRTKEGSADYRYFPDPDLPSLKLSEIPEFSPDVLKATLPELPNARRERYIASGVKAADADQFASYPDFARFFDEVIQGQNDELFVQTAANYVANDLVSLVRDTDKRDTEGKHEIPISARNLVSIVRMVTEKKVTSRVAKDLLRITIEEGGDPEEVAFSRGLLLTGDSSALRGAVTKVVTDNATVVSDYLNGKEAALQFLIGQVMKATRGASDPARIKEELVSIISS